VRRRGATRTGARSARAQRRAAAPGFSRAVALRLGSTLVGCVSCARRLPGRLGTCKATSSRAAALMVQMPRLILGRRRIRLYDLCLTVTTFVIVDNSHRQMRRRRPRRTTKVQPRRRCPSRASSQGICCVVATVGWPCAGGRGRGGIGRRKTKLLGVGPQSLVVCLFAACRAGSDVFSTRARPPSTRHALAHKNRRNCGEPCPCPHPT